MSTHQEDLDLLLSLQERVLETPPASPSSLHTHTPSGYFSDDGSPKGALNADMSAFRDAVRDYLDEIPSVANVVPTSNPSKKSNDVNVEKFSGLRIKNMVVSPADLSNKFSDIRFIQLPAIRNLLVGDTISGCWATVGVLTEKGNPKVSSTGKNYCIWKIGCLKESDVSIFLFGDAYSMNWKEPVGTVFAIFNSQVRKDAQGKGFSLSVFSVSQLMKMGTSVDYGVCKGKRKDGMACTMVINKCKGIYCKYHNLKESKKYSTFRTELKGGNLRTAFKDPLRSEGIYMVDPLTDRTNLNKNVKPVKVLSVDGLKKALSNAGKVTTKSQSQGIRFLTEVAGKAQPQDPIKVSSKDRLQQGNSEKRFFSSSMKLASNIIIADQQPQAKRRKPQEQQVSGNLIELEIVSSDEG